MFALCKPSYLQTGRATSHRNEGFESSRTPSIFFDSTGWKLRAGMKGIRPLRRRLISEHPQRFDSPGWKLRVGRKGIRALRRRIVKDCRNMGTAGPDWPILYVQPRRRVDQWECLLHFDQW